MKTDGNGRKTLQPFSTFNLNTKTKAKTVKPDIKTNANLHGKSSISKTNQFERNYVEHGRYTKNKYRIPPRSTKCITINNSSYTIHIVFFLKVELHCHSLHSLCIPKPIFFEHEILDLYIQKNKKENVVVNIKQLNLTEHQAGSILGCCVLHGLRPTTLGPCGWGLRLSKYKQCV